MIACDCGSYLLVPVLPILKIGHQLKCKANWPVTIWAQHAKIGIFQSRSYICLGVVTKCERKKQMNDILLFIYALCFTTKVKHNADRDKE